jgi:hypothetical protein
MGTGMGMGMLLAFRIAMQELEEFSHEIGTLARIQHPHIIRLYGISARALACVRACLRACGLVL